MNELTEKVKHEGLLKAIEKVVQTDIGELTDAEITDKLQDISEGKEPANVDDQIRLLEDEIGSVRAENSDLKTRLDSLEEKLSEVEQIANTATTESSAATQAFNQLKTETKSAITKFTTEQSKTVAEQVPLKETEAGKSSSNGKGVLTLKADSQETGVFHQFTK